VGTNIEPILLLIKEIFFYFPTISPNFQKQLFLAIKKRLIN
jgi:hypothetical protein